MVTLAYLSIVAADEGNLEEAESLAREARALVDRFELQGVPQSSWASIALGYFLAKRGDLVEAQTALEDGHFDTKEAARSESLARPHRVARARSGALRTRRPRRGSCDARRGASYAGKVSRRRYIPRASRARGAQTSPLRTRKSRMGQLGDELTKRELDVLRLFDSELSTQQIAQRLYVAPSTVRTYIKSINRKLGVSSREEAVKQAHTSGLL